MATRTRTVVFTDLANYTDQVTRSDRAALRNLIAVHEKMVLPVLERHGGRVVKNLGDSYMALFRSATDAVRAGLELVDVINDPGGFAIRVAMATGDVEVIDGDAFGDAVNLAARIAAKTPSSELWFSEATFHCMKQSEVAWEPVGRFELKGIPGEPEVFRAVPAARAWLPEAVAEAVRTDHLVRLQRGDPLPPLPPNATLLLEGFAPGSKALVELVAHLPVLDPSALWLSCYKISPIDRVAWERAGRGLVLGMPAAVDAAITEVSRPHAPSGSDTIILDITGTSVLDLVMDGLALPRVPLSEVVAGYSYDLLSDGRWVHQSERAVARVDVGAKNVTFSVLRGGFAIGGRQLMVGQAHVLRDGDVISSPHGPVRYQALQGAPYQGLLLARTDVRLGIAPGQQAEIGREPRHPGLALPDRRGQVNLRWCLGNRAARAKESGFTLDRALAGRRQSAIVLGPGGASLLSLHKKCHTYLLEEDTLDKVIDPRIIVPGDRIIVGTSVVTVASPDS